MYGEQPLLYLYVSKDNEVGNYWDRKGLNEIDIIALNEIDKTAVVAEIKHQRRKFSPTELAEKSGYTE